MSFIAAAVIGTQALSGYLQSRSIRKASQEQARSEERALEEQRRQFDLNRADLEPWRVEGGRAIGRLGEMAGPGGELSRKFTVQDFLDDPVTKLGFQTGLERGTQALDRMAGARGSRNSGGQLKALTQFGTDYGGMKAGESYGRFYGDQDRIYNRLAGIAGTGQTATTAGVQAGTNIAGNIGNILTAGGNARGAAAIARGNALSGGLSTLGQWYQQQNMLDRLGYPRNSMYGGAPEPVDWMQGP